MRFVVPFAAFVHCLSAPVAVGGPPAPCRYENLQLSDFLDASTHAQKGVSDFIYSETADDFVLTELGAMGERHG